LRIDGKTEIVGIVGYGIEYTMSPAIHNAAFSSLGMNWAYIPLRVLPQELEEAMRGLRASGFKGFNVTVPHKVEATRYLDELREPAGLLEAVNTVVCDDGKMIGFNTDVEGFRSFIEEAGIQAEGSSVLLVGAGGASRAVALALAEKGVARIFVMNRTAEKAEDLSFLLKRATPATEISVRKFDREGSRVLSECDIVVNCTPLAGSEAAQLPLDYGAFEQGKWAIDLKYAKEGTAFLREASSREAKTADGEGMLIHQAAASFRLWTGRPAPLREMRQAYRGALTA
jgi:shikimate dehydrogenase